MKTILAESGDRDKWDRLVRRAPAFSLMQTFEWGEFKQTQGWHPYRLAVLRGREYVAGGQMLIRPLLRGLFSVAYVPRGPLAEPDDTHVLEALFSAMHRLACQQRAVFLKVEPPWEDEPSVHQTLDTFGFLASGHTNQPRTSILVDLTSDPEVILARMRRSTRYNVRLAHRKGVVIHEGTEEDLPTFYALLRIAARRGGFPIRPFDYYQHEFSTFSDRGCAKLLLANYQGTIIAAHMAFACGERAASLHSASSGEPRHLKANELLAWEAMKWARNTGCRIYDLWGIPDEAVKLHASDEQTATPTQGGLWGVYQFKRGFGGELVCYVGAYDYVYSRQLYALVNNWLLRRMSVDQVMKYVIRR